MVITAARRAVRIAMDTSAVPEWPNLFVFINESPDLSSGFIGNPSPCLYQFRAKSRATLGKRGEGHYEGAAAWRRFTDRCEGHPCRKGKRRSDCGPNMRRHVVVKSSKDHGRGLSYAVLDRVVSPCHHSTMAWDLPRRHARPHSGLRLIEPTTDRGPHC
jgi:hypothetical protein